MNQYDHGPDPFVTDIEADTLQNDNFRTTLWTGKYMQATLMTIPAGGEIGLEVHEDHDQFLRIEEGTAKVHMGASKNALQTFDAEADYATFVPAGTWHNIVNVGDGSLKLYSIYSPGEHPKNTVHATKEDADADEEE